MKHLPVPLCAEMIHLITKINQVKTTTLPLKITIVAILNPQKPNTSLDLIKLINNYESIVFELTWISLSEDSNISCQTLENHHRKILTAYKQQKNCQINHKSFAISQKAFENASTAKKYVLLEKLHAIASLKCDHVILLGHSDSSLTINTAKILHIVTSWIMLSTQKEYHSVINASIDLNHHLPYTINGARVGTSIIEFVKAHGRHTKNAEKFLIDTFVSPLIKALIEENITLKNQAKTMLADSHQIKEPRKRFSTLLNALLVSQHQCLSEATDNTCYHQAVNNMKVFLDNHIRKPLMRMETSRFIERQLNIVIENIQYGGLVYYPNANALLFLDEALRFIFKGTIPIIGRVSSRQDKKTLV